ncbi:zinc ribbon domain-containing protein [Methanobrevibacter sp.]|uniref:zinc ribbon domain-containing protein n=1 Tax=Methanobrevibacter sp. TaxID=66852 RepID=UPI00388D9929
MSKKICENCGKAVDDYVKFCPDCGLNKFRQANPVSNKSSSIPTKKVSQNSDWVHKLFYWNYDGSYIFSKTKLISFLTFAVFVLSMFTGPPVAVLIIGLIFTAFFYLIGFCIHKILGNDKPSDNVLNHNDYGLVEDLKNALLCWQNKKTGEFVYSKTKIITLLIFLFFTSLTSFAPTSSLLVCVAIGIMFAIPASVIGYAIHKLTNNNPTPKKVTAKPKPQVAPKVEEKKVEEKRVDVEVAPKVAGEKSEFAVYQSQLNELKEEYDTKENHLRDLIAKRFEPPQLTYNRFITAVDNCTKLFNEKADSIQSIIDLASDDSKRVDDEIKSRMEVLKSLIDKIDDLTDELVLNMSKSDDGNVKDLLGDMEDLIDSVKNYD